MKNKKGISIVKATIILISLCIVISIFITTWFSGIVSIFMINEKIEIIDVWSKKSFEDYFFISIDFKNVGNTIVKVCDVHINGKPYKVFSNDTYVLVGSVREGWYLDKLSEEELIDVKPGEIGDVSIAFPPYAAFPGQKIHITIYTINGREYHVSLILEE